MQSLAETSDHGFAQYYMGMMYLKGQGVDQDYEAASNWFRKASEKNIPQAQYKLGDLYFKGRRKLRYSNYIFNDFCFIFTLFYIDSSFNWI